MRKNIHPEYNSEAKVKCACGKAFNVGSTKPQMEVEICYSCHPFYTGKQKLVDTAGRVEKFKARAKKASEKPVRKKSEKAAAKKTSKVKN